jgi:hypothetical protein
MNLPKRILQHQIESKSYAILLYKLRNIGIFRNLTENDYGIDFEIEVVRDGKVTGKFIKAQVKGTEKIKIRKKDKVPTISGIKQSTLYYWTELSQKVNVIIFAVDIKSENIYMTKPIFWQAVSLLDKYGKSKTIEFLSVDKYHGEVASILTTMYAISPSISDYKYFHINLIRNLKDFLDLYWGVYGNDVQCTLHEPEVFRHFLEICQKLLWERSVKEQFPKLDQDSFYDFNYWSNKGGYGEHNNYICRTPMGILMPVLLNEVQRLYKRVLDSTYYWLHKDISYLQLVYCNPITDEVFEDIIDNREFEYEKICLKSESEFNDYILGFIENYGG